MVSIRDIKRRARRDVHKHLRVPVLYLESRNARPVKCFMRIHTSNQALGDMKGTSFSYAERTEFTPSIIIDRTEIARPMRGAIISVEPGEAYRIDHVEPADGETIKATVVPLTAEQASGLPIPETD